MSFDLAVLRYAEQLTPRLRRDSMRISVPGRSRALSQEQRCRFRRHCSRTLSCLARYIRTTLGRRARYRRRKRQVIRELAYYILQAKATQEEVEAGIRLAGVKSTATPAVLLSRGLLREQLAKVGNLPESEMGKSFRILISLLSVADARRRRVECANGCQHPWHNLDAR